jgi:hypothetical protein
VKAGIPFNLRDFLLLFVSLILQNYICRLAVVDDDKRESFFSTSETVPLMRRNKNLIAKKIVLRKLFLRHLSPLRCFTVDVILMTSVVLSISLKAKTYTNAILSLVYTIVRLISSSK